MFRGTLQEENGWGGVCGRVVLGIGGDWRSGMKMKMKMKMKMNE
jgi:hypothetical protein